jgi:hypothetical protein
MAKTSRALLVAAALTVLVFLSISAQVSTPKRERGEEWLSWSPAQRSTYISGYVTGYLMGSHDACGATDQLFEVGKPHRLYEDPSARCQAHLETYSSRDTATYTTVITEFYTKYPQYRDIPYPYLLKFETDNQHKTADELHAMALDGRLRTNF